VAGKLSEKARRILALIADGHSYAQIVDGQPDMSYLDIFSAADEALNATESPSEGRARMAAIKARHPRAYERWESEEDDRLRRLIAAGEAIESIGGQLGRQPSAIRSHIAKLGLDEA